MAKINSTSSIDSSFFGHPKGLLYLFFAELWERFSFYGMRALLTLYMVNVIFEALLERDAAAAAVYASYGSLVYASTVIGGRISDSLLGFRKSILLGGVLMALGHFVLAIETDITFFLALGLIVVGNGFFKPNISSFVATLYEENDPRKDSGFVIFYMGINIGGFISPLLCGWLGYTYGWHYGFGLAGIGMLAGLLFFWSGIKGGIFKDKGLPPTSSHLETKTLGISKDLWITILAFLSAPLIALMLASYKSFGAKETFFEGEDGLTLLCKIIGIIILACLGYVLYRYTRKRWVKVIIILVFEVVFFITLLTNLLDSCFEVLKPFLKGQNAVNLLFKAIGITVISYLAYVLYQSTAEERKKLIVAIFITLFMTIFWGFHELHGSVITLFADRNVDLPLINSSQTNSLNSMFIIILSIPISLLFGYLSKNRINPRTPYKFGIGLLLAGVGFYVLSLSGGSADENGMVPFSYLLVLYFLLSVGELFMSPVGLSKITDLSPQRIVGFMMGIWFLSSAYAFQIVGFIGEQLAVESESKDVGGFDSLYIYLDGFDLIAKYSIGAGLIVVLISPILTKLMGRVH